MLCPHYCGAHADCGKRLAYVRHHEHVPGQVDPRPAAVPAFCN
jgi:hypothetical protein